MNNTATMPHQGRNIKRIREILGVKQDALAIDLGLTQQAVSLLEQKEVIDMPTLQRISGILKVPVEAIEHFDEERAVNIIANTINNNDNSSFFNQGAIYINPIEELKKLHEEKIELYERMLKEKDEMMAELKKLIK